MTTKNTIAKTITIELSCNGLDFLLTESNSYALPVSLESPGEDDSPESTLPDSVAFS